MTENDIFKKALDWRNQTNHAEKLIGMTMEVRTIIASELAEAKKAGKIPVFVICEDHLDKTSYFTENVVVTTVNELQKQQDSSLGTVLCSEAGGITIKIHPPERYLTNPAIAEQLQKREEYFSAGVTGCAFPPLVNALHTKGAIEGILLMNNFDATAEANKKAAAKEYYLMFDGEIAGANSVKSRMATWSEEYNSLEKVGVAKMQTLFPVGTKQTPVVAVGGLHAKGIMDLLKEDDRFHAVCINAFQPSKDKMDLFQLPKAKSGKITIAHKLVQAAAGQESVTTIDGIPYAKDEPISIDITAFENKIDFLTSPNSPKVKNVFTGIGLTDTFDNVDKLVEQIINIAKQREQQVLPAQEQKMMPQRPSNPVTVTNSPGRKL